MASLPITAITLENPDATDTPAAAQTGVIALGLGDVAAPAVEVRKADVSEVQIAAAMGAVAGAIASPDTPNSAKDVSAQTVSAALAAVAGSTVTGGALGSQVPNEILFVDSSITGYEQIIAGARAGVQVVVLDPTQDGFAQITAALAGRQDVAAVHLVTHGDAGQVALGNTAMTVQSLAEHSAQVSSWSQALSPGADFLIYGCDVGQGIQGTALLDELSTLTGADSAASSNLTGSGPLGSDWNLEVSHGTITTQLFADPAALTAFTSVLAKPVVDLNGPAVFNVSDNFSTPLPAPIPPDTYYNRGSGPWTSGWVEFDASPTRAFNPGGSTNSDNSPTGGNVVIPSVATGGTVTGLGTGQEIAFVGHGAQYGDYIQREVNLKAYTSAILSFSYRTAGLGAGDVIEVDVSNNNGANFVTVGALANVTTNTTATFDISGYISETTTIRLAVKSGFATASSQQFFFDNVSIAADGNNYVTSYSEQAVTPVQILSAAAVITDPDTGQLLRSATVTLANPHAGDSLAVGALPTGITPDTSTPGTIVLSSATGDTAANFASALQAITFSNSSHIPDTSLRSINITVTDAGNETSLTSTAFVHITPYDDPIQPVVPAHNLTVSSLGTTSGMLFDGTSLATERTFSATLDYDLDTAGLSTALLTPASKGTAVVNADGTYTYTPNAGATGTDSFTYTLTSAAQVIGVNYQYWDNSTITSLATGFPATAPYKANFIVGYNVDGVALDTVGGTATPKTSLDNFVIRFTNTLTITNGGTYTFTTGSDDGSMLYIDTTGNGTFTAVVNNDGLHSYAVASGSITLAPGTYTVRVDFMERTGQEDLNVYYQGADTGGLQTNLSDVGQVLANSSKTGTVNLDIQTGGPELALGTNVYALDNFTTRAYTNNNGVGLNFSGNWTELIDGNSATAGQIQITTAGVLQVSDTSGTTSTRSISRPIDLLALSGNNPTIVGYQLSLDYSTPAASQPGVFVQISADGGTSWATLDTITANGATGTTHKTYDISSYASSNVVVRFLPAAATSVEIINFDNVRIDASQVNYTAGTYIENAAPGVAIASAGTVIGDPNLANVSGATVTIANYVSGQDLLSFTNQNGISGSWNAATGALTLSGTATAAQYETALQNVFYSNTSDNPSTASRTINVAVTDANTYVSNTATTTVAVIAVNDAPLGIDGTVTTALNTAFVLRTSDFAFTDVEGNSLLAVKITSLPASVGTLQWNNGTTWTTATLNQLISATDIANGRLRLVPNTGVPGNAVFTFEVQDNGGTANGGVDTDPVANSFTVHVLSGTNHAPTLSSNLTLVSSPEDSTAPTSEALTQLATGIFTDTDTGSYMTGLAIVGNTANAGTQGIWQYSVDGSTWTAVGTVGNTAATALALSAVTQVRFVPVADYNGAPPALSVRALDDTYSGSFTTSATRVFVGTAPFGSTAISAAQYGLGTTITPVNDAPVLTAAAPTLTTIPASQPLAGPAGQLISDFVGSGANHSVVTDIDASPLKGVAIIAAGGSGGSWQYSTNGGTTWNAVGSVSVNSGLLLDTANLIRFNPDGTTAGSGTITYRAWDETSGSIGAKVDASAFGGTTAFSSSIDSANITVTAPTGPVLSGTSTPLTYVENAAAGAIDTAVAIVDSRSGNLIGATVTIANYVSGQDTLAFANQLGITGSWNATTGTLTLSSPGGVTLANYQTALRSITYSNSSDAPDSNTRTINIQVSDSTGPSNVLSTSVNVSPVNDAPQLTGASGGFVYVENQVATPIDSTLMLTDPDSPANFNGGNLQVALTASTGNDQLSVLATGGITVVGSSVKYGTFTIGTIDGSLNGVGGNGLQINLNFDATPTAVQALAHAIGYANSSNDPSELTRGVTFTLNDGGNLGSGLAQTGTNTADTIKVASVPEQPTITSIVENAGGGINATEASDGTPIVVSLTGTHAQAGDTLTVTWGGQTFARALTAGEISGNSATVTVPAGTIGTQGDGTFNVTASVTHPSPAGGSHTGPASAAFPVTVDTTPPAETISSTITTDTGLTGTITSGGLTKDATLGLSGTVSDANGVATVQVYDGATLLGAATVSAGTWSYTTATLADGLHTLTAKATDNAGNTFTTAAITATVDTVVPAETISSTITTDTGLTGTITSGGLTKDATLGLTGTVSDANGVATVQVYDGATLLGTATVNSGNWSYTTGALGDGLHTLTAKATDNAGNTFTTAAITATVDTTLPAETISSTITTDTGLTGTIASGGLTKDATLGLTGTVSDANGVSTVQVYDGATLLGTATVNAGNWSYTTAALGDGLHTLTAKATDNAGNTFTTAAITATVDTVVPAETISSTITTDTGLTGTITSGGLTKDATLGLTGTVSDANGVATVQVYDGATLLGAATVSAGTWSYTTATLADGLHTLTAKATDNAGNIFTTAAITATVDTVAPTATVTGVTALSADTGTSASDFLSNAASQTVSGTLTGTLGGGETLQVSANGGATWVTATVTGGTWSASGVTLAAGAGTLSTRTIDTAGNANVGATHAYILDTTLPSETLSSTITTDTGLTGTIASGGLTKDATLGLSGTVSDANGVSTVQVYDGATLLGTATVSLGNWSYTTGALADGLHTLTAKATDNAGNTFTTAAITATVDTVVTAPAVALMTDSGASGTDHISNVGTLALGGIEAGALVEYSINGTTWTGGFTPQEGANSVYVRQTDAAGNVSSAGTLNFTLDTTIASPVIATLMEHIGAGQNAVTNAGATYDTAPTLNGTAEAGSTMAVYDGSTLLGTATADGSGAWSFTPPAALRAGIPHSFTVTATDVAGNLSSVSTAFDIAMNVDLANLGPVSTGVKIPGEAAGDNSGFSMSGAGDVNGDGYADIIIGAPCAAPNGNLYAGRSYVVFGKGTPFDPTVPLLSLDGSNGFHLSGVSAQDVSGWSVAAAGDVNGDGFSDVIVGAIYSDPNGSQSGAAYVVFGKASGFGADFPLSSLNGSNGFRLDGAAAGDQTGISVTGVGDVNGDGYADVLVGSYSQPAGASYLVFGKASGFAANISLSSLDGTDGFRIVGVNAHDNAGQRVSAAGDINGDGFADFIIGAPGDWHVGYGVGATYVVFGNSSFFGSSTPGATLALSSLNGTNGFEILGLASGDGMGIGISSAGDLNGDGYADLVVSARHGNGGGGEAYVVFGKSGGFGAVVNLSQLDGNNGFHISSAAAGSMTGYSVSAAGDFNGDGYGDLIVGAPGAYGTPSWTGESYIVFGKATGFPADVNLATLGGTDGFRISGVANGDASGYSVSAAGDVNGDGFADIAVSSAFASPGGNYASGETYIIFGSNLVTGTHVLVGGAGNDTLTGTAAAENFIAGQGNDTMIGNGGKDAFSGGAGNDTIHLGAPGQSTIDFVRIDGGSGFDTLVLDGSNATLDLTTAGLRNTVVGIERIDLGGHGNSVVLDIRDVLNLSDTSNQLFVTGAGGDAVTSSAGWAIDNSHATVLGADGHTYDSYTLGGAAFSQGMANLLIDEQLATANVHLS